MKVFATLTAAVCLLATTGLAHAGPTITSPAIFGGHGELLAFCAVRNVGKTLATAEVSLLDESGHTLVPTQQRCNGADQPIGSTCRITPGGTFSILALITPGFAYACSATGAVRNLRGAITVGQSLVLPFAGTYRSAALR